MMIERALSKLAIHAYVDREMKQRAGGITALYNPQSIELDYQTDYARDEFINSKQQSNRYQQVRPGALNIELIFDATLPGNPKSVDAQLAQLRSICCAVDASTGAPRFLQVKWGRMSWNGRGYFAGRMTAMQIRYTLFDRDASPLRAAASLTLTADDSLDLQESEQTVNAPDSALLSVPDMASLPLIAAGAASLVAGGAAINYLSIAYANDLDSLDDFAAGDTLLARAGGAD